MVELSWNYILFIYLRKKSGEPLVFIETGQMSECLTVAWGLTCSWRGTFVATRAPGFTHTAAAKLFAQLGRHWVQTLPPWADQTEASPFLLLDGRCAGCRGLQEEDKEEEVGRRRKLCARVGDTEEREDREWRKKEVPFTKATFHS